METGCGGGVGLGDGVDDGVLAGAGDEVAEVGDGDAGDETADGSGDSEDVHAASRAHASAGAASRRAHLTRPTYVGR